MNRFLGMGLLVLGALLAWGACPVRAQEEPQAAEPAPAPEAPTQEPEPEGPPAPPTAPEGGETPPGTSPSPTPEPPEVPEEPEELAAQPTEEPTATPEPTPSGEPVATPEPTPTSAPTPSGEPTPTPTAEPAAAATPAPTLAAPPTQIQQQMGQFTRLIEGGGRFRRDSGANAILDTNLMNERNRLQTEQRAGRTLTSDESRFVSAFNQDEDRRRSAFFGQVSSLSPAMRGIGWGIKGVAKGNDVATEYIPGYVSARDGFFGGLRDRIFGR